MTDADASPRETVVHAIVERSARWRERPALVFGDSVITYADLMERVRGGASWLKSQDVGPGCKVAVLTMNHPLAVVGALAAMYVGATWVPANPRDSGTDIAANLDRVRCDLLLHGEGVGEAVTAIRAAAPRLGGMAELDVLDRPARSAPGLAARPDDAAAIFFTGGTTGRAKGVVFLHRNFRRLADHYIDLMLAPDEVTLAAAPLTHVAGRQCLAALAGGTTTVILPQFDAGAVLAAIERHRVTAMTATPTMLYMLLNHPDVRRRDLSSMRRLGYGAAPIALDRLKEAIEVFGPVLQGGYGQTESPMLIACLRPEEHVRDGGLVDDARLRSVGRPTSASDVRIVGPGGEALPAGAVGEITVAGDYQMHEYFEDPETTAAARIGRHLRTGDLGFLDDEGYLTICGRIKDMIITGGFNVYSAEVESALASHPAVYEAAVFGLPDPLWGEAVSAAVQLREGCSVSGDELRSWVHDRVGGVKTPKRIEFVTEIPRNHNGKILKRILVERFARVPG